MGEEGNGRIEFGKTIGRQEVMAAVFFGVLTLMNLWIKDSINSVEAKVDKLSERVIVHSERITRTEVKLDMFKERVCAVEEDLSIHVLEEN